MTPAQFFEPGDLVRHPSCSDWGLGQVQSVINGKITVNFENRGKVVIDAMHISLRSVSTPYEPSAPGSD